MKDLEKIRQQIHLLKPKTFNDLEEDMSNLDSILKEYEQISKVARDLVKIPGKTLHEALTTQAAEFYFFRMCLGNLKSILDYYDAFIKHTRGKKYGEIKKTDSRDLNDRSINHLIDSDDDVFELTFDYLRVKDTYDKFLSIVESYTQRGYSLNNITKSLEIATLETVL